MRDVIMACMTSLHDVKTTGMASSSVVATVMTSVIHNDHHGMNYPLITADNDCLILACMTSISDVITVA